MRDWLRWIFIASLTGTLPVVILPTIYFFSTDSVGRTLVPFSSLFLTPFVLSVIASPLLLILVFFRKTRPFAIPSVVFSLVSLIAISAGSRLGGNIRMAAFDSLGQKSMGLVQAIEAFKSARGHWPSQLDELVPDFLPAIPSTGMSAYPHFEYHATADTPENHSGNPWVLILQTPMGFPNWDRFMYFPRQNYPERGYGGRIERLGNWAYVHE